MNYLNKTLSFCKDYYQKNKTFVLTIVLIICSFFVFSLYNSMKTQKIVVFDLDETLGHFVQLGMLVDSIEQVSQKQFTQSDFNNLLDLYPELIRPKMFKILEYIKHKKKKNECNKVIIYTNNNGPKRWGNFIKKYFEHKLKYPLFNDLIGAYKINGVINEPRRTSQEKSYDDLQSISKINKNQEICFLDDMYHPKMIHKKVYYIYLPKYKFFFKTQTLLDRFINSSLYNKFNNNLSKSNYYNQISFLCNKYKIRTKKERITDNDISYIR